MDPEFPGSIPGPKRFSEKYWIWNGVHSVMRITKDLLESKYSGSGLETRD
jgi:hypothetical protein